MSTTIMPERNYDGRTITHSTPRYRGTSTTFTSIDDDQTDPSKVWGGSNQLMLHHQIGQATTQTVYMDFNTIDNKSYLLTGHLAWKDALHDQITCQIVPKVTTYSAGINTDYDLFGGYLIIPNGSSTGSITVNDADRVLVQVPLNEFGERASGGYWDADYNTTTKQFENIVPNATGTGGFNMFAVEVLLYSYLNQVCMIGDQNESLTSYDADQLAHGTRLKFTFNTIGADHEWHFSGTIAMFRTKSV